MSDEEYVDFYDYDEEDDEDSTCNYCCGTGGDPWNDGILPCPEVRR